MSQELTMDVILKTPPEEFVTIMKSQPMGTRISLINILKMQYEQCNMARQALVKSLQLPSSKMPEEDREAHKKVLSELYLSMQIIEDRHNILLEMVNNKGK